jgi:hypothetical protein
VASLQLLPRSSDGLYLSTEYVRAPSPLLGSPAYVAAPPPPTSFCPLYPVPPRVGTAYRVYLSRMSSLPSVCDQLLSFSCGWVGGWVSELGIRQVVARALGFVCVSPQQTIWCVSSCSCSACLWFVCCVHCYLLVVRLLCALLACGSSAVCITCLWFLCCALLSVALTVVFPRTCLPGSWNRLQHCLIWGEWAPHPCCAFLGTAVLGWWSCVEPTAHCSAVCVIFMDRSGAVCVLFLDRSSAVCPQCTQGP